MSFTFLVLGERKSPTRRHPESPDRLSMATADETVAGALAGMR